MLRLVRIMIKLRVRGMLIVRVMLRDKVRELQDHAQGHG